MAITKLYLEQIRAQDMDSMFPAYSAPSAFDPHNYDYILDNLNDIRQAIQFAMGPNSQWDAAAGQNKRITHQHTGGDDGPVLINISNIPYNWSGTGSAGTGGTYKLAAPWDHQHPNYLLAKYAYRRHTSTVVAVTALATSVDVTGDTLVPTSVPPISSSQDGVGVVSEALPPTIATNVYNKIFIRNAADNLPIFDPSGNEVYGRLSTSGTGPYTHTLFFYYLSADVEYSTSFSTNISITFQFLREYEWDSLIASGSHKDLFLSGGIAGESPATNQHIAQLRADIYSSPVPSWTADGTGALVTPLQTLIENHLESKDWKRESFIVTAGGRTFILKHTPKFWTDADGDAQRKLEVYYEGVLMEETDDYTLTPNNYTIEVNVNRFMKDGRRITAIYMW